MNMEIIGEARKINLAKRQVKLTINGQVYWGTLLFKNVTNETVKKAYEGVFDAFFTVADEPPTALSGQVFNVTVRYTPEK